MKLASCVLVPGADGRLLSVSRRNDFVHWGLPGGKVDEHESSIEAAQREASEEVGLFGGACQYTPLLTAICPGEVTYWVTTYLWVGDPVLLEELRPEAGLAMGWKSWEQLCDPTISPFAGYNAKVAAAHAEYIRGTLWARI